MSVVGSCPHCGTEMDPIVTPETSSWGGEIHHVCLNDDCCYFVNSWRTLGHQGVDCTGYRCRVDARGSIGPVPVRTAHDLKHLKADEPRECSRRPDEFRDDDFTRDDDTPDSTYYRSVRWVNHLDSAALETVHNLYGRLTGPQSRILDLMAGPDSHLHRVDRPAAVVGLGLNEEELKENPALSHYVVHDLNGTPTLPFPNSEFDVVVNTVSVEYMTQPLEVFREVARILKTRGVFIVVFSNRMFPPKAVKVWKRMTEADRIHVVKRYFDLTGLFTVEGYVECAGKKRRESDTPAGLGALSDPVYAIWARPRQPA